MTKPDCTISKLSDRGVLAVAGDEAKTFLQGLITNDMDRLQAGAAIHAGLLTPQGKILFDFFVIAEGSDFLLECPKSSSSELAKRLTFYKLRAAVEIEDISEGHTVCAAWGGAPQAKDARACYGDPRLAGLGHRLIMASGVDPGATGCAPGPETAYHAHRIGLGIPEGGKDFEFGDAFPHEADFDQLNGVDFKKGCYVGQEVVSRMEHRGTARKRIVPVEGVAALPGDGCEISASGMAIGRLGSVSDTSGLALLRLDRAEKARAEDRAISAGDVTIRLRQPEWASFKVPVEGGKT